MTILSRRAALAGAAATAVLGSAAMPSTGRAAAPLSGKPAANFYRYKLGDFEVTVVTDGLTSIPLPGVYVANASKEAVASGMAAAKLPADKATHRYTPIVVNTGAKLVVIDTGLGPALYERSKGTVGQFQTNLAAAGIDRNAVDAVIISHFHGDHINGLLGADNKAHYPNAEVMVPAAEWAFWMDDGQMSRAPEGLKNNFNNARRVFGALGNKVTKYEAGKEIVPGITSVASYGHTLGHTSHIVASGSDKVLVQADITAGMAVLFVNNPEWQLQFDMNKGQAVETRKKLYEMAMAEKMPVQGFHFPYPGLVHVEKSGSGFRLVPVP